MSGHSKWSTIKRAKGANDAKRGQAFTKASANIAIAARDGGNPDMNFKLRLAIDAARAINMPKDNIERAIARGSGAAGGDTLESISYEGYAHGGVALLVDTITDNKTRTAAQVRSTFDKNGGNLGGPGSVAWMFNSVGEITIALKGKDPDEVSLELIDAGAEEFEAVEDSLIIYTTLENYEPVKKYLEENNYEILSSDLTKKATTTVKISATDSAKRIFSLMEKLEDLDDVLKVYANFDIDDEVLSQVA